MREDYEIAVDDSTYSLLDAIVRSNDDPLRLAELAEVDPDDFRQFLIECGEVEGRDAIQLLKAAKAMKFSNTATTISIPTLDAKIAVSKHTQRLTFMVLSKDPMDAKELGGAVSNHGASLLMLSDDEEQVFNETRRLHPSAVVINLSHMGESGLKLAQSIVLESPRTAVICASRDPSPDLILRSMRAGAREFIRLPINDDELSTVVTRTAEFAVGYVHDEPKKRGRAIAVFSGKGGCGTTLIATNLAMAQKTPTVLVDLDLQSGDLDLLLGLKPRFSLADVVANRDRLDDTLFASYITPHSKNLSLLAAPPRAENAEGIEPKHIYEIMERLRQRYDNVIIDTQSSFDPVTISALDHADQIVMVLTLEIPAIRSARRALEIFDRLGYARKKIRLVVNRWNNNIDFDQKQVEDFLGERVIGYIPSDYRVVVNSVNLGQPAVISAPSSAFTREIVRTATFLSDDFYQRVKTSKASKDSVRDLLTKANVLDDFIAHLRLKEST